MDVYFDLNGVRFVWDRAKAQQNVIIHDGVEFEHAAEAFFDPFLRLVDASGNDEDRDAVIGYDASGRLLFVVHVQINEEVIRIISARKATLKEREHYDS
jgi:uncharacterized protein